MKIKVLWRGGVYGVQGNRGEDSVVDQSIGHGSGQLAVEFTELVCLDYRVSVYG